MWRFPVKTRFASFAAGILWLLAGVPAFAHHSFAAVFDANKPIKLAGAVTKVEWKNPHAWVYIDVKDETGKVTNWAFELNSASALLRSGWRQNTLKLGDEVTVEGNAAKDGSERANVRVVLTSTGQRLFSGSTQENQPASPPTVP